MTFPQQVISLCISRAGRRDQFGITGSRSDPKSVCHSRSVRLTNARHFEEKSCPLRRYNANTLWIIVSKVLRMKTVCACLAGAFASRTQPRRSTCEDLQVVEAPFEIRPARDEDRLPLAVLFAAVAQERDGIGAEPPVDVDARAASWKLDGALVAIARDDIVGWRHVEQTPFGCGEIGMMVAREWRGVRRGFSARRGGDRLGARARRAQAEPQRLHA